ncbi:MAG: glycosyltransferase [Alphaproteobacteria bacterium]|nr:glycosyltransferase [Alphaproteobacteria bacterium]MDE2493939.1 glycosyltransferase [Alphaproteobacteria bacterium]
MSGTSFKPSYGGPAISVARLAKALSESGVEISVWAPDQSATIGFPTMLQSTKCLSGTLRHAILAFGKADVIHDNGLWWPHNSTLSCLAAEAVVPRIVSTRGMLEPWALRHKAWKKRFAWWLYQKKDLERAARLHATSDQEAENLRRLGLSVSVVSIPNGVDLPVEGALEVERARLTLGKTKIALFLGRIYPVKGLPMLIDAWARVRPAGWMLHIAGPDEAGHRLVVERAVAANRLEESVRFLGPVVIPERMLVYAAAALFILPSYSESFGMVVAEALAHGLPVLTTTGAPWPNLVARGCGWRTEPTSEGIANALREATSCGTATLRAMGAKGQDYVAREFSWSASAQRMIDLYKEVIAQSSNPSTARLARQ